MVRDAWAGQADCALEAEHADREDYRRIVAKNQEPGTLALLDCPDTGLAYGLVVEYGGERTRFENFVSDGATRRALQMVENDAEVGIAIRNFTGPGRNSLYPGPPWGRSRDPNIPVKRMPETRWNDVITIIRSVRSPPRRFRRSPGRQQELGAVPERGGDGDQERKRMNECTEGN